MGQLYNIAVGLVGGALLGALVGGAALWLYGRLYGMLFWRGGGGLGLSAAEETRIGALLGAVSGLAVGSIAGTVVGAVGWSRLGGALAGAMCGLALVLWALSMPAAS